MSSAVFFLKFSKMAVTIVSFRWLEILEKEFDKNFVDLDLLIGDLDGEEPDFVYSARQKLAELSSCFAQLTHKAQTIFQNSAKIEAELVDLRAELVNSKTRQEILEEESRNLVLQLHSLQLDRLPSNQNPEQYKEKIETALKLSPTKSSYSEEITFRNSSEIKKLKNELLQYQSENIILRNSILALHSEVYGARLAAKYLDKELAGRIQQLQLLGKEMRTDIRDKLWRQLESEILLHRHKTVIRACRNRTNHEFIQSDSRLLSFNQSEQRFLKNEFNLHQSDPLIKFDVNNFCRSGDGIFFNKSEPRYVGQMEEKYHNQSDISLNNQSSEFKNERNSESNDSNCSKENNKNDVENSISSIEKLSIDNINNNANEKDIFLIATDPSNLERREISKEEEKTDEEKMVKDELKATSEEEKKVRSSEGEDEFSCMIGEKRTVIVKRQPGQGLGISITGGREHGVPILISELEVGGPAYDCRNLYVGDAILKVNNVSLENASHFEAVKILTNLETNDVKLLVQFIAVDTDEENSLSEDLYGYRYRFFDTEVMDSSDALGLHPLHANSAHTPTAPRTPDYSRNERNYSNYMQSPKQSFDGYYSSPSHSDEVFHSQEVNKNEIVVPPQEDKPTEKLIDVESPKPEESERLKIDLFGFRFQTDMNDIINYENEDLLDDFLIKNSDNILPDADLIQMKETEEKKPSKQEGKLPEYIDETIFSGLEDHSILDNIVKSFSEDDFSYLDNDKDKNVTSDSGLEIYLSGSDIDIDKRYFEKRYKDKNYLNESIDNSPEKIELKTLQQIFDRSFSSNLSSPRGSTSFDDDILSTEHSDEKSGNSVNDFRNKMKDMKNTYNPKKIQKFYPKNMDMSEDILKKTFKSDPLTVVLKNDAANNCKKSKRNSSDSLKRGKNGRKSKENIKKEGKPEKVNNNNNNNKNSKEADCEFLKPANAFKKRDANYKITDRFDENLIEYNVKQYDVDVKKEEVRTENFEPEKIVEKKDEPADEMEETRKLSRKYGLKIPGKVVKSDLNNRLIVTEVKSPDRCIKVIDGHFKHFKPILNTNAAEEKETKMKAFRSNRFDSFGDPDFGTPV